MFKNKTLNFLKLDEKAVLPSYAKPGDAGMDITCISKQYDEKTNTYIYGTGLAVEIPNGYVGLIFPRSSIFKTNLSLANHVGVIDSQYRGEIKFIFRATSGNNNHYEVGDRVGQLMVTPYPSFQTKFVDKLSNTERGTGGFGSSGK